MQSHHVLHMHALVQAHPTMSCTHCSWNIQTHISTLSWQFNFQISSRACISIQEVIHGFTGQIKNITSNPRQLNCTSSVNHENLRFTTHWHHTSVPLRTHDHALEPTSLSPFLQSVSQGTGTSTTHDQTWLESTRTFPRGSWPLLLPPPALALPIQPACYNSVLLRITFEVFRFPQTDQLELYAAIPLSTGLDRTWREKERDQTVI